MLDNPKEDYNERVLGMQWNPKNDVSKFSKKKRGGPISPDLSPEQLSIEFFLLH